MEDTQVTHHGYFEVRIRQFITSGTGTKDEIVYMQQFPILNLEQVVAAINLQSCKTTDQKGRDISSTIECMHQNLRDLERSNRSILAKLEAPLK